MVFQCVPQAGLTWKVPGFTPVCLVGHLSRCLSVPARHGLWGIYPTFVDWIVPVTKSGHLRLPVCHTALYRLAIFTDLLYRRIQVASVVAHCFGSGHYLRPAGGGRKGGET